MVKEGTEVVKEGMEIGLNSRNEANIYLRQVYEHVGWGRGGLGI